MKIRPHTATFSQVGRRGLIGVVASALLMSAAACGGSAPGPARSTPLPCASLPGCTPPPTASSTGVPAGLPAGWSSQAIHAATVAFATCAQSTSLQPPNCPQGVVGGPALAARWTVLNQPLDRAVAIPASHDGGTVAAGQVTVYGHFQMTVSYTTGGQAVRPYLDYVGGLAEASMTWDGQSFQNVQFVNIDAAAAQPAVTMPPFARPVEVTDANAIAAVKAGFDDCATLQVPLTATTLAVPNCPQQYGVMQIGAITSAQWSMNGDPTQGALVSFDTAHGNFAVTGSYHMDLHYSTNNGNSLSNDNGAHLGSASGNYTATLAWNGQHLTLLKITAP